MLVTKITLCLIVSFSCFVGSSTLLGRAHATMSSSQCKTKKHKPNGKAISKRRELAKLPTYTACGCGCCGGLKPQVKCLYRSKGDDIQKIIEADKETASNTKLFAVAVWSFPLQYKYCD